MQGGDTIQPIIRSLQEVHLKVTLHQDLLPGMTLMFEPGVSSPSVTIAARPQDAKSPFALFHLFYQRQPMLPTPLYT